jgi:glycosyltransferase involved in cell wall biosynthesis
MIIGIDASRANKKHKTGVEWYSYHLIQEFKKIDSKNQYFLYTNEPLTGDLAICPENFKEIVLNWPLPRLWTLGRLSWEMKFGKYKPDILFVPAHTIPLLQPEKTVVTVHDIGFEHIPEAYKWPDKLYHRFTIQFIKRFSDKIITVSNYSKNDLVSFNKIDPKKISVVYNGFDTALYNDSVREKTQRPIQDNYILFIGRLEEKKNIGRLLEAFALFKKKNPADAHKLVLIGKKGFGWEKFQQIIGKNNLADSVVVPGWVEESQVPAWFAHADLFAFPSLFEGFGIPVLQAMACGTPVICSNTTSLPEAAGESALMFNPEKPEEIASRMAQVLLNPEVADSLIVKGERQAEKFSWRKCAEETLEILVQTGAKECEDNWKTVVQK